MASLQRRIERRSEILIGDGATRPLVKKCEISTCRHDATVQTQGKFFAGLKIYLCDIHAAMYAVAGDSRRLSD